MAIYLNQLGYDLILNARNKEKLEQIQNKLKEENKKIGRNNKIEIIVADLSKEEECIKLHKEVKEKYETVIDLLINNAGFGLCGEFVSSDLEKELEMIDTNIKAVHILTKLFLQDMVKEDKGRILNVASISGFMPGPLMATYYATKNYVVKISEAIRKELKKSKSKVKISILCPGPVATNFDKVANVKFNLKQLTSDYVAKYAIDKVLKDKFYIVPGLSIKLARIGSKMIPNTLLAHFCYYTQTKKI